VAVSLLASYRTGLKIALWHSLLLFVVLYAQAAMLLPAVDTAPQAIEWDGGGLARREFREFAFLGRLPADARRATLVLPVRVRFADGTTREWRAEVAIQGSVGVTPGGAFVFAAGAFGVAVLAVALALRRPR